MERPFLWCCLVCLCLWPRVGGQGSFSSCYIGDSDCPPCPANRTESWTSTILYVTLGAVVSDSTGSSSTSIACSLDILNGGVQMVERVREAQEVIQSYGEGIIEIRPLLFLHTTLNYFCCHTVQVSSVRMCLSEWLTTVILLYAGKGSDSGNLENVQLVSCQSDLQQRVLQCRPQ